MKTSLIVILAVTYFSSVNLNKIEYLSDDLSEDDNCVLSENPQVIGECKKISDCANEFEKYRKNETVLKICVFSKVDDEDVICCPQNEIHLSLTTTTTNTTDEMLAKKHLYDSDFLNFDVCRERYLEFRTKRIEDICPSYPGETCRLIINGRQTEMVDWQIIAALGWTQEDGRVEYKCGGFIISDRFIITAAHCRDKGKNPDTVRLGDRYLLTREDDKHSQQLKVEKFIRHPDYKGFSAYNDIAMIKIVEIIKFTDYVAPACIGDIADNWKGNLNVAGYGKTNYYGDEILNILLEIDASVVPSNNCSEYFDGNFRVNQGILPSQICVQGRKSHNGKYSDTCHGDSGGPIKYMSWYEKDIGNFRRISYQIPVVIGIVSFGIECGLNIPSVNTRVAYYREWILSTMNELAKE